MTSSNDDVICFEDLSIRKRLTFLVDKTAHANASTMPTVFTDLDEFERKVYLMCSVTEYWVSEQNQMLTQDDVLAMFQKKLLEQIEKVSHAIASAEIDEKSIEDRRIQLEVGRGCADGI